MQSTLTLALVLLLHSHVTRAMYPTYEELQQQLPIPLQPGGGDHTFFFIIPVQKSYQLNVVLQMAQAQSATHDRNASVSATVINTKSNETINFSLEGENLTLDDVFEDPVSNSDDVEYYDNTVIMPLHFRFRHDPDTSNTILPQCTTDIRTWTERVVTRIAEKMDLPEQYWDHNDLTIAMRMRKDALSMISLSDITTVERLAKYVNTTHATMAIADIRYGYALNHREYLNAGHVPLMAEGLDTYWLLNQNTAIAREAADTLTDITSTDVALETAKAMIDVIEGKVAVKYDQFKVAYQIVKQMQKEEREME